MPQQIEITVMNRLLSEKRSLNGYIHAGKSAYIISPGNGKTVRLSSHRSGDYLHLSIAGSPGDFAEDCWINLPSQLNFSLSNMGNAAVVQTGRRTLIKIPPGPLLWQLKISCMDDNIRQNATSRIIVGDSKNKPDFELDDIDFDTIC